MGQGRMDDGVVAHIAQIMKAMGDPTRLRILECLREAERGVGEIRGLVGTTQANVSKHLRVLREAGMVGFRREGMHVVYRITDPAVDTVCEIVCGSVLRRAGELQGLAETIQRAARRSKGGESE